LPVASSGVLAGATAIVGADQLRAMNAPPALLLPMLTTMSAWLDFLSFRFGEVDGDGTGSGTDADAARISPEMITAAYRVGDTVTNLIPVLDSKTPARLAARLGAAAEHRVLPSGGRPDSDFGGVRNSGRTRRGRVVYAARPALNKLNKSTRH
jgi:hypothetical protein